MFDCRFTNRFLFLMALLVIFQLFAAGSASADDGAETLARFKPELSVEFITLLKEADVSKGEKVFMRKCSSCHEHEKTGENWKGPRLWNVFGRTAGTEPGFTYSEAMKNSGHIWDLATINYYLTRTDRAVPGLAMNFRGIKSEKTRARLIAFLRTLNDTPPPLPE